MVASPSKVAPCAHGRESLKWRRGRGRLRPCLTSLSRRWSDSTPLLWLLYALTAAQATGVPSPVFPAKIEAVKITVVVSDRRGDWVRGLTRDEFRVFEDGRP